MAQGNLTESSPNYDNRMESGSEISDSVQVWESNPISTIPIHLSSSQDAIWLGAYFLTFAPIYTLRESSIHSLKLEYPAFSLSSFVTHMRTGGAMMLSAQVLLLD